MTQKDTKEWQERFEAKFPFKKVRLTRKNIYRFLRLPSQEKLPLDIKNFIEAELLQAQQSAVESYKKELVEKYEDADRWRCTDMGSNNDDYVIIRKTLIKSLINGK